MNGHRMGCTLVLVTLFMIARALALSAADAESSDVSVDLGKCEPSRKVTYFPLGSQTIEVAGRQNSNCILKFGVEVENPRAARALPIECKVPSALGRLTLSASSSDGPFKEIAQYCVDTRTGKSIKK